MLTNADLAKLKQVNEGPFKSETLPILFDPKTGVDGLKAAIDQLCAQADSIFIEDLDFRMMAKGFLGKHTLDAGLGQFTNQILPWVCFKRDVFFGKVDARGTSQECPDCGAEVKKDLSVRIHQCLNCGSTKPRDIAAAQVICTRGQRGIENACGVEVTGGLETVSSQLALKQEIFGSNPKNLHPYPLGLGG